MAPIASPPPVDVVSPQSISTAPVEVSWSTSSNGADIITGYRIFYSNGKSILVPSYVTRVELNFLDSSQVGSVSLRSESIQLPSELIIASIKNASES